MLSKFLMYYRPHPGLFFLDFGCAIVAGLLELAFPLMVAYFIDTLLPRGDFSVIVTAALLLVGIYALNASLHAVVNYFGHVLGVSIESEMRQQAFDHLQSLSFNFFDNTKTGQIITHVTKDLEDVGEVAHHGPEDFVVAIMTLIGAFVLMLFTNYTLALVTTTLVPIITLIVSRYGSRMTLNWQDLFGRVGEFNVRMEEAIGGIRVVKAFANERHESALFAESNDVYRTTKLRAFAIMTASTTFTYLSTRMMQLLLMLVGSWLVIRGQLTYGGFVSFLLLVEVFLRPIDKITNVLEAYPKGIAGFRRFVQLLETSPGIVDRANAIEMSYAKGDIEFRNVSFSYAGGANVLNNLNLKIKAGDTIALVGPSGAGKTTLCALLARFYEADRGSITIDGINVKDIKQLSLRKQIGIVQQEVFIFGGTVRENITYGKLDATDDEIWNAVKCARLDNVIKELPAGLDTVVGERGAKLSGGQKQRLAIARIFLKNPPILILDEATSALDTETEAAIQKALADLARGRTTLVVAHRLATIRHADRIVVLDHQGIVEEGKHEELLSKNSAYARLHNVRYK